MLGISFNKSVLVKKYARLYTIYFYLFQFLFIIEKICLVRRCHVKCCFVICKIKNQQIKILFCGIFFFFSEMQKKNL